MRLILVRHGETQGNVRNILADENDLLTPKGIMQAKAVADKFKSEKIGVIFTSPYTRAKETAKATAKYHPETDFIELEELRERDLGSYLNKKFNEVNWEVLPPDVETRQDIDKRTKALVEKVLQNYPSETVMMFTHNAAIRSIVRYLRKGVKKDFGDFKNCSVSIFEMTGKEVKEILFNSTAHLK